MGSIRFGCSKLASLRISSIVWDIVNSTKMIAQARILPVLRVNVMLERNTKKLSRTSLVIILSHLGYVDWFSLVCITFYQHPVYCALSNHGQNQDSPKPLLF